MGEGGIPSLDAIPDEARSVQPSHMGFMDPLRTPSRCGRASTCTWPAASRKGSTAASTRQLRDRQGRLVWKSPQDVADAAVATPT
jgi:hypothetical protein